MSRVISSYTPTLKALSYAREKKLGLLDKSDSRLLLVNMPTTPEHSPLRMAVEVETTINYVRGKASTTRLDHPRAAAVLDVLPSHQVVHFTCHGVSDDKHPPQSRLLLLQGGATAQSHRRIDWQSGTGNLQDPLSKPYLKPTSNRHKLHIFRLAPPPRTLRLYPTSHYILQAVFKLAGFSHVLVTQWTSNGKACLGVTSDLYKNTFSSEPSSGGVDGGHRIVSAAFHNASEKVLETAYTMGTPVLKAGLP